MLCSCCIRRQGGGAWTSCHRRRGSSRSAGSTGTTASPHCHSYIVQTMLVKWQLFVRLLNRIMSPFLIFFISVLWLIDNLMNILLTNELSNLTGRIKILLLRTSDWQADWLTDWPGSLQEVILLVVCAGQDWSGERVGHVQRGLTLSVSEQDNSQICVPDRGIYCAFSEFA